MRKTTLIILLTIFSLLVAIVLYTNSPIYIESQEWKYVEGTNIGDWLGNGNIQIKDGLIHSSGLKARVIFTIGPDLIIEDVKTNERGIYVNKK